MSEKWREMKKLNNQLAKESEPRMRVELGDAKELAQIIKLICEAWNELERDGTLKNVRAKLFSVRKAFLEDELILDMRKIAVYRSNGLTDAQAFELLLASKQSGDKIVGLVKKILKK